MTGLANRQYFVASLTEYCERESRNVLVVRVNEAQEINESLGYEQESRVVAEVARRLRALEPTPSVIRRIGEDTFGVIVCSHRRDRVHHGA